MKSCILFLSVLVFLLASADPARSATAAGKGAKGNNKVLHQEVLRQERIQSTTKRVGDQLEFILGEFERNGITGEDVKVLQAIRGVLDKLSAEDMGTVLEYLNQSRAMANQSSATRTVTEAYAAQKSIVIQLRQIVLEYQRQQALYEISVRLKELAARQSANMWLGVALARQTASKSSFRSFGEDQKISLRYQQSEQTPLKEEVTVILGRLKKLLAADPDSPTADRPKAALAQVEKGRLMEALQAAAQELQENNLKLLSAVGHEKTARDQMREIARMLVLSYDPASALRQAILELDKAIDAEKKVRKETGQARRGEEAEKRAIDQAVVVDDTDLIRRDIHSLAPVAAEHLGAATDKMQVAREALESEVDTAERVSAALPQQDQALLKMFAARHALEEQLAKVEEVGSEPESLLAEMRDLQAQLQALIQKQEQLKEETASTAAKAPELLPAKASRQGELKDEAQEIQSGVAPASRQAAYSIAEAVIQMQSAQNALAQQKNDGAAQQAAITALQRAAEQLAADVAKLEQAEKDLEQVEDLMQRLVVIIEEQQSVQRITAREALDKPSRAEVLTNVYGRQVKITGATDALQKDSLELVPAAASHLGDASVHMRSAGLALEKKEPEIAEPEQAKALASLYLAKKEFENSADELRELLGEPPTQDADALAEAQRRVEEAQQQVADALEQLQQAPPGLMDMLQKQQQAIADTLQDMCQNSETPQNLAGAEQSAAKAAQQLASSDLPKAIDSMKAAERALAQAGQQSQPTPGAPSGRSGNDPDPSVGDVAEQQAAVRETAENILKAQLEAPPSAFDAAAEAMQKANEAISPLAAGALGQMPSAVQTPIESAQGSTAKGSAQSSASQSGPAQQSANSAAQALAQAQAALALAQAGVGAQAAAGKPSQGEGQGKGQGQGQGQGRSQRKGQGRGQPGAEGDGKGNWAGAGGADGPRREGRGTSSFIRLPHRDRAAIQQSQAEKYPQEYGPLVEQYLRNLSDQATED